MNAKQHFDKNIERVKHLGFIYTTVNDTTTSAVDLSGILRAQYVMLVSALDYYLHELIRSFMIEIYKGNKSSTKGFKKFIFSIDQDVLLKKGIINPQNEEWLNFQILYKNGFKSFQHSSKIVEAFELITDLKSEDLWKNISNGMGQLFCENDIITKLNLIIERRNQIAHEADIEPTFNTLRSIYKTDVEDSINFIETFVTSIDNFTQSL
ncbi:HEPN domain-containing protein [Aliarcobacter butzleri]